MRKRSAYKPKHITTPAMRSSPDDAMKQELMLIGYRALDAVMKGHATREMFDCIATTVNVTTVLAEMGKGREYLELCKEALAAVRRMGERGAKSGRYGVDGIGYTAIKDCLELHKQQIEITTRLQISNAMFEVERRVRKQTEAHA